MSNGGSATVITVLDGTPDDLSLASLSNPSWEATVVLEPNIQFPFSPPPAFYTVFLAPGSRVIACRNSVRSVALSGYGQLQKSEGSKT